MQWADYSAGRPSGKALLAAGFGGVIRYVGLGSASKRITANEYADLTRSGVQVLLAAELATGDAWGANADTVAAYARGKAYAQMALGDARSLGIPDSVGIAACADAHAVSAAQIACCVEYAKGFRDVLGYGRTGFYGFGETSRAVHTAGVASWHWRCGSEPSKAEQQWLHFWQRNKAPTTRIVSGVTCDINEQYNDVAVRPPLVTATTTTGGTDLMQRYTAVKSATEAWVEADCYGTDQTAIIIRPGTDADGKDQPVWLNNIFAWGDNGSGIGHNPVDANGGKPLRIDKPRKFAIPGALWANIAYSSNADSTMESVG